jgi:hypothetical protein
LGKRTRSPKSSGLKSFRNASVTQVPTQIERGWDKF